MLSFVVVSTFTLTGCLEEILASLCKKLASNNSIIAVLQTTSDYSAQFALLTYTNQTSSEVLIISDCNRNNFAFPNGERKVNSGVNPANITFVNVLDDVSNSFFFDTNGTPKTNQFSLQVTFFASCTDLESSMSPNVVGSSAAATLTWESALNLPQENIPLIGECEISGQSAVVVVQDL